MDDIPEDLWSYPVPSLYTLQNNNNYNNNNNNNDISSLDFQRFLQEFSIDHDTFGSKPPLLSIDNQKMVTKSIEYAKLNNKDSNDKNSPQESSSTLTPHERPTEYDLLSNVQGTKDDTSNGRLPVDSESSMHIQAMALLQSEEQRSGEMTKHPYYFDPKKMKRLVQNRESARRSRKKKLAQENEIEKQVAELKEDQDSKTKLVIELSHRFSEEVVNNRLLHARIEILKAKVKMAEDILKRVNPTTSFYHNMEKQPNYNNNNNNNKPTFLLVQHDPHRQPCVPSSKNNNS